MAILETLPGTKVTICANEQPLPEYKIKEVETQTNSIGKHQFKRTVSNYIELVEDKEFVIQLEVSHPYQFDCPALRFTKKIDGVLMQDRLMLEEDYGEEKRWLDEMDEENLGQNRVSFNKPLQFTKINITSDDVYSIKNRNDAKTFKNVGEIEVRVHRCSVAAMEGIEVGKIKDNKTTMTLQRVHEKSLKGESKSHGILFGELRGRENSKFYKLSSLDGWEYPLTIFRFLYRSRGEALQTISVIPRSPVPEAPPTPPPSAPFSFDRLSAEQKADFNRFISGLMRASSTPSAVSTSSAVSRNVKRENADEYVVSVVDHIWPYAWQY